MNIIFKLTADTAGGIPAGLLTPETRNEDGSWGTNSFDGPQYGDMVVIDLGSLYSYYGTHSAALDFAKDAMKQLSKKGVSFALVSSSGDSQMMKQELSEWLVKEAALPYDPVAYSDAFFTPKKLVLAYNELIWKLENATFDSRISTPSAAQHAYAFRDANECITVIWDEDGDSKLTATADGPVAMSDIWGNPKSAEAKGHAVPIQLSESPIYLVTKTKPILGGQPPDGPRVPVARYPHPVRPVLALHVREVDVPVVPGGIVCIVQGRARMVGPVHTIV